MLVAIFLILYIPPTSAQWNAYPFCAQSCLSNAQASSGCPLSNVCLCSNTGNFFGKLSACALQACDSADFDSVYSTLVLNCNESHEAVDYSLIQFESAGEEFLSSPSKPTSSVAPASTVLKRTTQPTLSAVLQLTRRSPLVVSSNFTSSDSPAAKSATQKSTSTPTSDAKTSLPDPPSASLSTQTRQTSSSVVTPSAKSSLSVTSSNPPDPPSVNPSTQAQQTSSSVMTSNVESSSTTSITLPDSTTATPSVSSAPVSASIPTPSNLAPPTIALCNDPLWEPTPENWVNANVDAELQQRTSQWGNGIKFTDFIGNYTGNKNIQCGIGFTENCRAPDCPAFQSEGGERWVYFASISLMEMNALINIVNDGIEAGTGDLSLVITSMANDFFPWKNPETHVQGAVPWLQALLSAVLSFIPVVGEIIGPTRAAISSGIAQTAAAFAAGGLQTLAATYSPVTELLGNMASVGDLVKNASTTARGSLGTWSATLFNGERDAAGNDITDYMVGGRWTFNYNVTPANVENFYFQSLVSDVVNDQLNSNNDSRTFVMCTNGTSACNENSLYTENGRSCCLYRIADNGSYIEPPELKFLQNSTFGIQPASITASSLHSYEAQGLDYTQGHFSLLVNDSLSGNLDNQFFLQGIRAQGLWTLPVCDVGNRGSWVADYSEQMMPCCCGAQNSTGIGCVETIEFFQKAHIAGFGKINKICAKQYPGFINVSGGLRLKGSMVGVVAFWILLKIVGINFDGWAML